MAVREKILKYAILVGLFLILLTPIIVPRDHFFPFISGKNFFFRTITEFIFGLWLILMLFAKGYRPKRSFIMIFSLTFLLVSILSTIFGANPYRSFWSNFERMEGLVTTIHLFAYFLVLSSMVNTEKLWKLFFHSSLAVSLGIVIYGFMQMAGKLEIHQSGTRLDATFGNASYLAVYMLVHLFITLFYLIRTKNWHKWFYAILAILQGIILYHTGTRGAIIGLVCGLALSFVLIAVRASGRKLKFWSLGITLFIILLVGSFWFLRDSSFVLSSPVLSRFAGISLEERTTQSRFVIWKLAYQGFKERPILGWGPENFNLVFNKYYEPVLYRQEVWFDRAHNVFFDKLTTNGILGLLSYLGLFISAIYYAWKKSPREYFSVTDAAILTGLFAGYFIHNLFVFDNVTSSILFFIVLAFIHSMSVTNDVNDQKGITNSKNYSSPDGQYRKYSFSILIAVVTIGIFYHVNIPSFLTSRTLIEALMTSSQGKIPEAFQKFETALAYDSLGKTETREQLMSFASQVLSAQEGPNITPELKSKIYDRAVSEMTKQVSEAPDDIRYLVFLANLYNRRGLLNNAVSALEKALALSPKKQAIYFELVNSYLNLKQYEKAFDTARTAFEMEPTYTEARAIYAVASIYNGKSDIARKLFMDEYGTPIIGDQRLVNAYFARGDFESVAEVWKKVIEEDPMNLQYRISLAATYLQAGKRQEAIKELEKAIEIEPQFKPQGTYYIDEIKAGRNP